MTAKIRIGFLIFKNKLFLELGLGLLLLLGTVFISYKGLTDLQNSTEWVEHTHEVKLKTNEIQLFVRTAESGQRGFLLTEKDSYLTRDYYTSIQKINSSYKELLFLARDNQEQYNRIANSYLLVKSRLQVLEDVLQLTKLKKYQEAKIIVDSSKGSLAQAQVSKSFEQIKDAEEKLLTARIQGQRQTYQVLSAVVIFGGVISMAIVFGALSIASKYQENNY